MYPLWHRQTKDSKGEEEVELVRRWRSQRDAIGRKDGGWKSRRREQRRCVDTDECAVWKRKESRGGRRSHSWVKARLPPCSVGRQVSVCCVTYLPTTFSLPSYSIVDHTCLLWCNTSLRLQQSHVKTCYLTACIFLSPTTNRITPLYSCRLLF